MVGFLKARCLAFLRRMIRSKGYRFLECRGPLGEGVRYLEGGRRGALSLDELPLPGHGIAHEPAGQAQVGDRLASGIMEGSAIPRGGAPRIAVDRPPAYPENLCDVSTPHRSVAAPRRSRSRGSGSARAPHGVPANDVCASRPSHRIGIARFSPLRTGLDSTGPGSSPRSRLAIALVNTGVDIIVGGPLVGRGTGRLAHRGGG